MIKKIRQFLSKHRLDAIVISRTDSFLGEYYPPEKEQLEKATGFTGSAGLAVITQDQAVLFVDSRYTEQAKTESGFQVFEIPTETLPSSWMVQNLTNLKIGYNPDQRSVGWVTYLMGQKLDLTPINSADWPELFPIKKEKAAPVFDYDIAYCGETTESKIQKIAANLTKKNIDAYVFTVPDSVSYILNQRSLWVPEYPVVFKRLIVFANGKFMELSDDLSPLKGKKVGLDLRMTPMAVFQKIKAVATVSDMPDPVEEMKSVKNEVEQQNIRQACLFESRVLCRFLAYVEGNKAELDELSCDTKLKELRAESPLYRGDSFDTIAAVGPHAAMAHYQATPKSNMAVTSAPLLLVDTGGNYLNGTTDMTRTICVGVPTDEMKKRYTQVLKGHIALATSLVHKGDLPCELDLKARSFLRADGVDYGHSTGHGIGMYLAVHEAPPTIYEKADTPLKAGMLFSNEPAYYKSGEFGIRLENMILTDAGPDDTLILENLLWVPFDGRLVQFDLLTDGEREWLRAYHKAVQERIFPDLTPAERQILQPLLDFFL
ncbi:MAG: M24 family metallopeptidase [Alphaproteobacteria bacterium]|nr:M24 family metallopeptidase [Alphaproteobacteria bacterium]